MEIIIPVVIFILVFIACSVCGYCCKRNKQGIVYGTAVEAPVTTTTTSSYQTGQIPYPAMMPQPVAAPPAGFAPHAAYPPTTPYPPAPATGAPYPPAGVPHGYHPMPMPMTGGFPGAAPYPTAMPMPGAYTSPVPAYPANSANQLPPSYDEAVQNRTTGANINEGYSQQSPYNPNYN